MSEPNNNVESILTAILKNDSKYVVKPQSRVEELLLAIYENGGGGGGGSDITRYEVEQMLLAKVDVKKNYSLVSDSEIERLAGVDNYDDKKIWEEVNKKVSKENGKSLIVVDDYDSFKTLRDTTVPAITNNIKSLVPDTRTIAGKDLKQNISASDLLKALSLDKVNNTSDADKPISTATQNALDKKVNETELSSAIDGVNTTISKVVKGDDSLFFTDSEEKSTKIVPENAVKCVTAMIGGKSIKCRNIFNNTKTSGNNKGLFWVINPDKSITLNTPSGATSGQVDITLAGYWGSTTAIYPNDTYTIINANPATVAYNGANFKAINNTTAIGTVTSSSRSKTFTGAITELYITVDSGKTFNNYTIYPMLVRGTTTDITYEPYFEGLRSAPVEKVVSYLENAVDGDFELGSMDGSSGVNIDSTTNIRTKNYLQVEPSTVYEFDSSGFNANLFEYNSDKNLVKTHYDINKSKFTTSSTTAYIRFRMVSAYGTTYRNNIRLVKPYNKIIVPVPEAIKNLPDYGCSAGDVYNYVDFENMVYHHRIAKTKVKNMEWYAAPTSTSDKYRMGSVTLKNTVKKTASGYIDNILAYKYARSSADNTWFNKEGICVDGVGTVFIYDSKYSSSTSHTSFATDNADMEIYYELATEELIDISDILFPFLCESGGTITFENEHDIDVPNTVIYEKEVLA